MESLVDRVKSLEEALKCEVCKELLNDPLLVSKCGHSTCRQCFLGDFSMKCPICQIPVNTKDSLEDKLLKELLLQLKRLKDVIEKDSENLKFESNVDPKPIFSDQRAVCNVPLCNTTEDKNLKKVADPEIICPTAPNFACSTPRVRRKKKTILKNKSTRFSNGEHSNGNSEKSTPTSVKRRSVDSSKSEENSKTKKGTSPNTSIFSSSNLNKKNHKGETLLHQAVIKGDIVKIKELIEAGASVNTQDNNGWTPLHEASNHGYIEIAKLLLDNGALVNVPSLKDNITPVHDALINDQIQIAIILASRGADLHAKTSMGYTALDLCKNEDDKAALIESCSPFISVDIPAPVKKTENEDSKIVILYTSMSDKQKEQLNKFAQLLKADIVDEFSLKVTHIVTSCDANGNCTRTLKVLLGILAGKWIMNFQWVEVCLEYKQKVDEEVFEVQGTKHLPNSLSPREARKNMEQKYPPLFDGFYFYLHGNFKKPTPGREDLLKLIYIGGGEILSREPREETINMENYRLPYHAPGTAAEGVSHIILYQEKPPRGKHICDGHIRTSHVMWLIECISEFKLKEFHHTIECET